MKMLDKATINFSGIGRVHITTPVPSSVTTEKIQFQKKYYLVPIPKVALSKKNNIKK